MTQAMDRYYKTPFYIDIKTLFSWHTKSTSRHLSNLWQKKRCFCHKLLAVSESNFAVFQHRVCNICSVTCGRMGVPSIPQSPILLPSTKGEWMAP